MNYTHRPVMRNINRKGEESEWRILLHPLFGIGTMYTSYIASMHMYSPLLLSVHYSEDSDRLKVTNVHFWRHVNYDNYHPMLRVWVPGTKILSRL